MKILKLMKTILRYLHDASSRIVHKFKHVFVLEIDVRL